MTDTVRFNPDDPLDMLLTFRRHREEQGARPVTVFDVAQFPDDTPWAYVSDGTNRSGTNPLRGLGHMTQEPFIDLSHLYRVPVDQAGVVSVSLGSRFPGGGCVPLHPVEEGIYCSYLQHAAILAHAEGYPVTGILVSVAHARDFRFSALLAPGG